MNKENEQQLTLSHRRGRLVAFLIDCFTMVVFIPIFILAYDLILGIDPHFENQRSLFRVDLTIAGITMVGFFKLLFRDSINGNSLGKWIMGIMVKDANDPITTVSIGRIIIRNLFLVAAPIEFVVLIGNKEYQRLGDIIAKTVVVQNPLKPKKWVRFSALISIPLVLYLLTFSVSAKAVKHFDSFPDVMGKWFDYRTEVPNIRVLTASDPYKVAVRRIEKNQIILMKTGGIKGYGMTPVGSFSTIDGRGSAEFKIQVLGYDSDINVTVYLTKEPDEEWELIKMNK